MTIPQIGTKTLYEIFSLDSYFWIPQFQRNYTWLTKVNEFLPNSHSEESNLLEDDLDSEVLDDSSSEIRKHEAAHVNELLRDLFFAFSEDSTGNYYMGSIITFQDLQNSLDTRKPYQIIDGQQRITTLCFIISAIYKKINKIIKENNIEDTEHILFMNKGMLSHFLKRNFPNQIMPNQQILETSNEKADIYLKKYFNSLDAEKRPYNENEDVVNNLNEEEKKEWQEVVASSKEMIEAVEAIDIWADQNLNIDNVNEFVSFLTTKTYFSHVPTTDFLEAYDIFEKSNYRGAPLLFSDLVKHYIIGEIAHDRENFEEKATDFNNKWNEIERSITSRTTNFKFDVFVRYFFMSEYKRFLRTNDIIPWLKGSKVSDSNSIIGDPLVFIQTLKTRTDWFVNLRKNQFKDGTNVKSLEFMKKYFQVQQVYSVLLAACQFDKSKFEHISILLECLVFSMKWSKVAHKIESEIEDIIQSLFWESEDLNNCYKDSKCDNTDECEHRCTHNENIKCKYPYEHTIRIIIEKYINTAEKNIVDDKFLLLNCGEKAPNIAKYILHKAEYQIRLMSRADDIDTLSGDVHVDHILEIGNEQTQAKAHEGLTDVSLEEYLKLTYRIGNLALLHFDDNINDFKNWTPQEKYKGKKFMFCGACDKYYPNNHGSCDVADDHLLERKTKDGYSSVPYLTTSYIVNEISPGTGTPSKKNKVLNFFKLNRLSLSNNYWKQKQVLERENIIFHILSQSLLTEFNPHKNSSNFKIYKDIYEWSRLPAGFVAE